MKIDLLITELEPGGAERCCTALAVFASKQNHEVRVISLGHRPIPGKDFLVQQLEDQHIPVHFLDATRHSLPWIIRNRLLALIASHRPDRAQGFLWHANWIGASAYSKCSIPFYAGVRVTEPRKWRAWLSRKWSQKSHKIICVSQDVAQWCRRVEGAPPDKMVVIPNGIVPIDRKALLSDPRPSAHERILLFVGRLTEQKGIDGLIQRAPQLLGALPEHRLVILGEGPLRASIENQRAAMPCSDRITVLGHCDSVASWMRHAELLLHPARYEGMPNAVLEAMAFGLAVVAFRVEGISELLGVETDAQCVAKADWERWLALAIRMASDTSLRHRVGEANRRRAETEYRLEDQLAKYLKVWFPTAE